MEIDLLPWFNFSPVDCMPSATATIPSGSERITPRQRTSESGRNGLGPWRIIAWKIRK